MAHQRLDDLIADVQQRRVTRREVLVRASTLGLSAPVIAGLLTACGGEPAATMDEVVV